MTDVTAVVRVTRLDSRADCQNPDPALAPVLPWSFPMRHPSFRTSRARTRPGRRLAGALAAVLALSVAGTTTVLTTAPPAAASASVSNPPTPGSFTGYGFDQCLTPTQQAMNTWLRTSPFLAVGVYISGASRACRDQPNLTAAWVKKQLTKGWRLLPITLGPQASCQPRFPRYGNDPTINPAPGKHGLYGQARTMGRAEADSAVAAAKRLGIVPGSTLFYDLEGYDNTNTHCRESALAFLTGWTNRVRAQGYLSGVYSSASSGIVALDKARRTKQRATVVPDQIWIADWDGIANTSTTYIGEDGWRPGGRLKQYRGGHDETWGGVRINIDSNYLDLGQGSVAARETHCGGVRVDFERYQALQAPTAGRVSPPAQVTALQCLLTEQGIYTGRLHGTYNARLIKAVNQWQREAGQPVSRSWTHKNWMSLTAAGPRAVLKHGSAGTMVRRVQRALNAARPAAAIPVTGTFEATTTAAVKGYQKKVGLPQSGVVEARTWRHLANGVR